MKRLVAVSDLHLDARTQGVARWDEIAASVSNAVHFATSNRVDGFLFLGDLSDPDSASAWTAASFAVSVARDLSDAAVPSLWLAGNHDVCEDGSGASVLSPLRAARLPLVEVVERCPRICTLSDIGIAALPFTAVADAYDPEQFVRRYREADVSIVVGHLNIEGATPGSEVSDFPRGREVLWPVEEIRRTWPGALLLGGHYHNAGPIRGVEIVGSIAALSHGEVAAGFMEVRV